MTIQELKQQADEIGERQKLYFSAQTEWVELAKRFAASQVERIQLPVDNPEIRGMDNPGMRLSFHILDNFRQRLEDQKQEILQELV